MSRTAWVAGGLGVAVRRGVMVAAALMAAGCAGGAASPPGNAGLSATASASATAISANPTTVRTATLPSAPAATPSSAPTDPAASPTAAATPGQVPANPPVAMLRGLDGTAAAGQLGSYTWGSGGSDAPWIVGEVLGTTAGGAALEVTLAGVTPTSWTSGWAEVVDGLAGSPSGGASGSGPVRVAAPTQAGDWSLRVTATFGPGHNATYFWHLAIT